MAAVPRAVLLATPELAVALAAARVVQGDNTEVRDLIAAAQAATAGRQGRQAERVRVLADLVTGGSERLGGSWTATAAAHRRVPVDAVTLAGLRISHAELIPVTVHNSLGTAALWAGDLAAADRCLRLATEVRLLQPAVSQLNAATHAALLRAERGELDPARDSAQEAIAAASAAGWETMPQAVAAYLTMASVALDRGEPGGVDEWLGRIEEVEAAAPEPHIQLAAALLLAGRREAAGELERALSGLQATTALLDTALLPRALTERWLHTEATLLARAGDPARSQAVLDRLGAVVTPAAMPARARLHLLLGDPAAGAALRAGIPAADHPRGKTEVALLDTLLASASKDETTALDRLEDALAAAAPWSLRRTFLTGEAELRDLLTRRVERGTIAPVFALDLLERMTGPLSVTGQPRRALVDPLTEREQTVLRYLTSTLTTAEIAAELYVSINTVKTHQRTLYRKLAVASRRAAVIRARELHLL
jgi:LuxR family maltose regulon positive regulatory protein